MFTRPRAQQRHLGAAFTLIELLLAVALLALLFAAVAFNFDSLRRGKALDEGVSQFEALLRISRAQAAASGRSVVLTLVSPTNSPNGQSESGALALVILIQPDPLRQPGLFRPLASVQYLVTDLADLIRLQIALPRKPGTDPGESAEPANEADAAAPSPLLTFLPDGSSEAADFILLSRDPEDHRRVHLHIDAVTGVIRRRFLSQDTGNADQPDEDVSSEDDSGEEMLAPTPITNPASKPPIRPGTP